MTARLLASCAALLLAMSPAFAQHPVRLGVANDMSGPYAALGGTGSVLAAQMAAEEFGGSVLGRRIEILSGDTQNKPDLASGFVREWFDTQGVAAVLDGAASSVGLAIQTLAQQRGSCSSTAAAHRRSSWASPAPRPRCSSCPTRAPWPSPG